MNKIFDLIELKELAEEVKKISKKKNIILLFGDLGAGKTTFVREYCQSINIVNQVSSPSFLILNTYYSKNNFQVNHFDLYRVKDIFELETIGFYECLNQSNSINFIEWPEKFISELNKFEDRTLSIYFKFIEDNINQREIKLEF
jgi:tRNA threonylcarbamoyladenosine biosynthesis protein TsaE